MKISTFNINSIHARLPYFLNWLKKETPDIVLLQEIKTQYNDFPFFEINTSGYQACVLGQKGYNGVAVLTKEKATLKQENLPNFEDTQARYIEVLYRDIIISSVYMPNGNPVGTEKFEYKLKFMDAFYNHAKHLLVENQNIIFGGDFNVIMSPKDVYDEEPFKNNALCQKSVRNRLAALNFLGFYDAYRTLNPKQNGYTYWDYGPLAFANDLGMRIDYFYLSASMLEKLKNCAPDKKLRAQEKPSDHTPLTAIFED